MPIELDYYDKLKPLTFTLKDSSTELVKANYTTKQGNNLTEYAFLLSSNDCAVKNYTSNYLSSQHRHNDIINHIMPQEVNDSIISKVQFNNTITNIKDNSYLTLIASNSLSTSQAVLTSLISDSSQNFVIDFSVINNVEVCNIWGYDVLTKKSLFIDEKQNNTFGFSPISVSYFKYSYDDTNNIINLFYTLTSNQFSWVIATSSLTPVLSVVSPNAVLIPQINVSIVDQNKDMTNYNTDNFVYYVSGIHIDPALTVSNDTNNFFFHTSYETWIPTISSILGEINFFNLKNGVSNNNFNNRQLPLVIGHQRKYNNIIANEYQETANERLQLGYSFFTKEYLIKSDKYTKFILPETISPFNRININDSGFKESGAYAAESPYFSDRVYKLQENNLNVNNDNESNGTLLCAWLNSNGRWYDRYYIPQNTSYAQALTSATQQVFTFQSELSTFIQTNGLQNINFYDVQSSLMLEPSSTYYYARIGNKYISSVLSGKQDNIIKDTITPFSIITNNKGYTGNDMVLDGKIYDNFNISNNIAGRFNISLRLSSPNIDSIKAYQLIGNNYNTGFALRKNFYFTPFILLQDNNSLYFYDTNFNLIKKNTYDSTVIGNIKDVCYVSQTADIVLRTSTGLFRTDITGQVVYYNTTVVPDVRNAVTGRTFYGAGNRAMFAAGAALYVADLQTLVTELYDTLSGGEQSVINCTAGIIPIKGTKGVNIDDTYAASLTSNNSIVFTALDTLTTFTALSTSSTIYDINAYNNNLYVQSNNKLSIFNTSRDLLSSISLSVSAVSGFKIDFISENYEIFPIVISRGVDKNLIVDKISLTTGSILSTYQLPFSSVSVGDVFINPSGFAFAENTYKKYENKLTFTANLQNTFAAEISARIWSTFSHSWTATPPIEYWAFNYSDITDLTDNSIIDTVPIDGLSNHINIDFNIIDGIITIHTNGVITNQISIPSNSQSIDNIVKNMLYVGNQNYSTKGITDYVSNQTLLATGATISDLVVYNISMSDDFIKYLYLKGIEVEDINIDVVSGSRNNIETVDNIFKYNIPGRLSNNITVYIKGAALDEHSKSTLMSILDTKLKDIVPVNISNITYNFDIQ